MAWVAPASAQFGAEIFDRSHLPPVLSRTLAGSRHLRIKIMTNGRFRRRPHVDRAARLCHDPSMDLEAARKSLSKRSAFTSKHFAFFGVVGLCLVAGALLRSGLVAQPEAGPNAPVAGAPSEPPVA